MTATAEAPAAANPLLPKPREQWVELYSGDFELRKQELEREMAEAAEQESATKRFGAGSKVTKLAKEYDKLMDRARAEGVIKMKFRSAGRQWRLLKDEHPPREGNTDDEMLGVNRRTFFEDAVKFCIAEPDFTVEQYQEFVETASEAHWERCCNAAWLVNEREVSLPKSSAVSLLQRLRDADSKSAETSELPPESSTENPSGSDTTTTTPLES